MEHLDGNVRCQFRANCGYLMAAMQPPESAGAKASRRGRARPASAALLRRFSGLEH